MSFRLTAAIVAAAALSITAGCSRSHTVATADGEVTYTEKGKDAGSVTFTGKDGEKVTVDVNAGKLPADYPSDVPVYKDAKINMTQSISDRNGRNLLMETSDSAEKVAAFYKSALESNGWKIEGTVAMGEMNMLTASKESREFVVQVTNAGEKRSIVQTVQDKR